MLKLENKDLKRLPVLAAISVNAHVPDDNPKNSDGYRVMPIEQGTRGTLTGEVWIADEFCRDIFALSLLASNTEELKSLLGHEGYASLRGNVTDDYRAAIKRARLHRKLRLGAYIALGVKWDEKDPLTSQNPFYLPWLTTPQ